MKGKFAHAKLQLLGAPPPNPLPPHHPFYRNLQMKRNENMGVDCSQGIEEVMQNNVFHLPVIVMNWEKAGRIWIWDSRYFFFFLNDLPLRRK